MVRSPGRKNNRKVKIWYKNVRKLVVVRLTAVFIAIFHSSLMHQCFEQIFL